MPYGETSNREYFRRLSLLQCLCTQALGERHDVGRGSHRRHLRQFRSGVQTRNCNAHLPQFVGAASRCARAGCPTIGLHHNTYGLRAVQFECRTAVHAPPDPSLTKPIGRDFNDLVQGERRTHAEKNRRAEVREHTGRIAQTGITQADIDFRHRDTQIYSPRASDSRFTCDASLVARFACFVSRVTPRLMSETGE
jgi:hypothetical protein